LKLEAPRTFYVALCITEFWISTLCHRPPSSPSLASSFPVHSQAFYLLTPCPLVYILFFPFPLQSTSTSYLCIGNTILISTVKLTRVFRKAVCSVYVEGESDITRRTSSFPQCDHRFTGTTYHPSASGRSHRALYERPCTRLQSCRSQRKSQSRQYINISTLTLGSTQRL